MRAAAVVRRRPRPAAAVVQPRRRLGVPAVQRACHQSARRALQKEGAAGPRVLRGLARPARVPASAAKFSRSYRVPQFPRLRPAGRVPQEPRNALRRRGAPHARVIGERRGLVPDAQAAGGRRGAPAAAPTGPGAPRAEAAQGQARPPDVRRPALGRKRARALRAVGRAPRGEEGLRRGTRVPGKLEAGAHHGPRRAGRRLASGETLPRGAPGRRGVPVHDAAGPRGALRTDATPRAPAGVRRLRHDGRRGRGVRRALRLCSQRGRRREARSRRTER
mmetsp:Transcript_3963/g.11986  ORF Transcript_3963/g.11986 Transcript_3963/m.11986 type:complete len:277 (+) Transcript_3963:304-1134(+)